MRAKLKDERKAMCYLLVALLLLTAEPVIITLFAMDSTRQCHCVSDITISVPPCENQCVPAEQLMLENEGLKLELQAIKQANNSEEKSHGFTAHLVVNGVRWTKFWWYDSKNWPTGETDVLGVPFGGCKSNASFCFSRLPGTLTEESTEILAKDSSGTMYRWKFDPSNPTAHAVWNTFYHHQEQKITHSQEWNPIVIQGPTPNRPQDSFMYRRQNGVMSVMLDDDNCDCYTTLSMGHGMCGNNFQSSYGPPGRYGVDVLYDTHCQTPDYKHGLALYFRDDDDCANDPCSYGEHCIDKPNGHMCV